MQRGTWYASPELIWFYASCAGEKHGPCTLQELREVQATAVGEVAPMLAWHKGMAQWMPCSLIPELAIGGGAVAQHSATYSWAYVPFIHTVLETGELAEAAARLAAHDDQWDALVREHRSALRRAAPDVLRPGHVADTNRASGVGGPPWPYIPAAPLGDEPHDPSVGSWPMLSAGGGRSHGGAASSSSEDAGAGVGDVGGDGRPFFTQEGLLSGQPVLYAHLQEMVRRIEASLQSKAGKTVDLIGA